jgi:hypothetical protein
MIDVSQPVPSATKPGVHTKHVSDKDPNTPPEVVESIYALFIRCKNRPNLQTDSKRIHRLL